ncbi:MAG: S8 family serine peptidase, partial [Pirellulaceae bacterium]
MKTTRSSRALRARQRFLRDPFFRSSHQQLEHLEQRRLLSVSPLATDSPDEPPVDPAWFAAVADPDETTRMGTRFLDHAATSQLPSSQVDLSRWIVKLSDDLVAQYPTPASANALFAGSEMEVLSGLGLPGQLLVGAHCTTTGQALEFFANEPGILYYEADTVQLASLIPSDPLFDQQIGLHNTGQDGGTVDADIDAPAAWEITQGHANVVVAIIDTGIDLDHPDLAANIWTNPGEIANNGIDDDENGFIDDVHGWDFRNNDADPDDDHRHGTHVAGTVGAVGNNGVGVAGIAWHTTLMPLKFLGHNNTGFTSDAVEAINYATLMRTRAENPVNVRVINNSYNGQFSNAMKDAIFASAAADILFVVASGNGNALGKGYDIDTDPVYPAGIDSPNSLVVGASGQFDELGRFSNYGVATVDLVAPGVGIVSTLPESMGSYGALSGTSMATPLVSGTAALIAANLPDITTAEIKTAILNTVDPLAELAGKVASGGRLNAAAAVAVDTYRPRVTLVSSNQVDSTGEASYPLQVTLRDNVALDLATLDNNDLRLLGPNGQQLNTVISHDTTSGPTDKEKTVTYQVEAPAGGWDSSFNGLYNLVAVAGQIGDTNSNTNLLTQLGEFEVEISLAGPMDVNSTDDLVDIDLGDDISNAGDNKSTLRSAIMQANATPGLDTIQVPGGTYTLTLAGAGEDGATTGDLDINESVILVGEGIDSTIINANTLDRVFDVAADATLTLKNMTIQGGAVTGNGGGIQALGNVILENVVLQGNAASGGTADGGGIYAEQGLNVTTSSITGNTAGADGGGIYAKQGLNVTTSSITGNTAGGGGGGIRLSGSTSSNRITGSLIAGNAAASFGGGLYTTASRSLTAENVTFSDNEADKGGAIQATNTIAPLLLNNVTITNNRAAQEGGGIRSTGTGVKPRNTIIAANTSTGGHGNVDIDGMFASRNNNLIGIPGNVTAFTDGELGDLVGATPGLTPLGDFGGPTLVHSLLVGSPAIDAGTFQSVPSHDQRGITRPQDGDGVGDPAPDIGAMEFILHGEIHGIKFHDRNQDGTQDPGEEGLEGWTMYLDSNDNDALDAGEPETTTAA